jgi:hypothetical protein
MNATERFKESEFSLELLTYVICFKKYYFPANSAHDDTAVPGALRIVANESLAAILRKDDQQMQEMFPSTPLPFNEILARLEVLQQRINALGKT